MKIEEFQKKFDIIGKSRAIKDLIDITMQIAKSDISVLIYGESGVGKEIFANAIHGFSNRGAKKLVSVNCGAIPEGILESELFGHKKGSFTGAIDDRKGYFEIANGGTLFLDEIAEMPLTTQVKLLRILETKDFMRLGSESVTKVDVRIIAATNKDLQKEVDTKRFRHDLYFRLKAVTLNVPPLRERTEDIPLLVNKFISEYAERNKIQSLDIDNLAIEYILKYSWPGNIRELKNTIETASALTRDGIITEELLKNLINLKQEDDIPLNLPVHLNRSAEALDREMIYYALIELKKDLVELKNIIKERKEEEKNIDINHVEPLEKIEKEAIIKALEITKGNKKSAANLLEISERTLYRKIKNYGII
ncbi:MAG: sigma-54-dependent Fis family transcriptional regulator [Ignavibacteriales bacterium]|nr:sigma-54-dependent Fis family transcriptional regulator [Ignavibacteriales bacterium]